MFFVIAILVSYFIFAYTDLLTQSSIYYLIPIIILLLGIRFSGFDKFFGVKEFIGTVIKNEIFSAEERRVKGGGFDALQDKSLVSELIVKNNNNGKTLLRTFYNGPITSNLVEGDKIAILRFIDSPVVIEGKNFNTHCERES